MKTNSQIISGIAAALVAFCPAMCASGAYLAEDPVRNERAPEVIVRPPAPRRPAPPVEIRHPVHELVERIEVGVPYSYAGLTIYPLILRGEEAVHHDVLTLDEAAARGGIAVRERPDEQVAEVEVDNRSRIHVLLMTGELIAGGKQNRIVREDVLLRPGARRVRVPVYCGEKERWVGPGDSFDGTGLLADARIRKMAVSSMPQEEVWREIDARLETAGVASPTRNYRDLYTDADVDRRLDGYVGHFRRVCARRPVGAVAVSGGRILGCDLFSDPSLFSREWNRICRSYAVQAQGEPGLYPDEVTRDRDIRAFLDSVFAASIFDAPTPGAGELCRIVGPVTGSALVWRGDVLHMALFPAETVILNWNNEP